MFCKKQDHYRSFKYCQYCAQRNEAVKSIFYCERCHSSIRKTHDSHTNKIYYLKQNQFTHPLHLVKDFLKEYVQIMREDFKKQQKQFNLQQLMTKSQQTIEFAQFQTCEDFDEIIYNEDIMAWLIRIKFWETVKQNTLKTFQQNIKKDIDIKLAKLDCKYQKNGSNILKQQKFTIDWIAYENDELLKSQIDSIDIQIQRLNKQRQIFNFFLKLYSSYNIDQCLQVYDNCNQLIDKYPTCKVLYLGKMRLCELLSQRNTQIPQILKQLIKYCPQFQKDDLYYYYLAISNWQMIDLPQNESSMTRIFYQPKNKQYYKLVNVDKYLHFLEMAIGIEQRPIYYIAKAIGYMVKQNFKQAIEMFELAAKLERNDSIDLNMIWVKIQNKQNVQFDAIINNIQTRTMQFIINLCRYFKNHKFYKKLVQCCQILTLKQPKNSQMQIQFIKSIILQTSLVCKNQDQWKIKQDKALIMLTQLKKTREQQSIKLQKRFMRTKAHNNFLSKNLFQSKQQYQTIIRQSAKSSHSDYYNSAASSFALFIDNNDDQLLQEAHKTINEAIKLKSKPKYHKLRFFILCYMNQWELANQIIQLDSQIQVKMDSTKKILGNQYHQLIEFVKTSLQ